MEDVRLSLADDAWERIAKALHAVKHPAGAPPELSDRDFVEAVLFVARASIPWRDLPARFGDWNAIYKRSRHWEKSGYWEAMFEIDRGDLSEVENLLQDSAWVRTHPRAAGARKKKRAKKLRAWDLIEEDLLEDNTLPPPTRTPRSPSFLHDAEALEELIDDAPPGCHWEDAVTDNGYDSEDADAFVDESNA